MCSVLLVCKAFGQNKPLRAQWHSSAVHLYSMANLILWNCVELKSSLRFLLQKWASVVLHYMLELSIRYVHFLGTQSRPNTNSVHTALWVYVIRVWSMECVCWKSFTVILRMGIKENKHNILNISSAKIPSMCLAAFSEPEKKLKFSCIHEY